MYVISLIMNIHHLPGIPAGPCIPGSPGAPGEPGSPRSMYWHTVGGTWGSCALTGTWSCAEHRSNGRTRRLRITKEARWWLELRCMVASGSWTLMNKSKLKVESALGLKGINYYCYPNWEIRLSPHFTVFICQSMIYLFNCEKLQN